MTLKTICEQYYSLEDTLTDLQQLLQAAEDEQAAIEQRLMVSLPRSVGVAVYEPMGGRSNQVSNPTLTAALEEARQEDRSWRRCGRKVANLKRQIARTTQKIIPLRRLMSSLQEPDCTIVAMKYRVMSRRPTLQEIADAVKLDPKTVTNRLHELNQTIPDIYFFLMKTVRSLPKERPSFPR